MVILIQLNQLPLVQTISEKIAIFFDHVQLTQYKYQNNNKEYILGASMVFNESLKLNTNGHDFIHKNTVKSLLQIPAIQGEIEFYKFLQQRFENQYEQFIIKQ